MARSNGNEPGTDYDHDALVERVQRTEHKVDRYIDQLLEVGAGVTRIEVTMGEVLRRVSSVEGKVTVAAVTARTVQPPLTSLTEEDFEDSPTGHHKIAKVSSKRFERAIRQHENAVIVARWKWALRVAQAIFVAAAALGVESLVKFLLHRV
jgi:hypothetical protein